MQRFLIGAYAVQYNLAVGVDVICTCRARSLRPDWSMKHKEYKL